MREPVEASGSRGSCWEAVEDVGKRVEDREGVGRGAGGAGEVREVQKAVGKCGRGGKAQGVTVRYSTFLLRLSPRGQKTVPAVINKVGRSWS